MIYPARNTTALATISAVENGSFLLESHNQSSMIKVLPFILQSSSTGLGITLRSRTAHSPWTNGKIETQKQHIARYWRNLLKDAGINWSSLAPKFAFAHKTSVKYTSVKTPYEIVL